MNAIKKNKTTRTVYIYIYIYITTTDVKKHVIFKIQYSLNQRG